MALTQTEISFLQYVQQNQGIGYLRMIYIIADEWRRLDPTKTITVLEDPIIPAAEELGAFEFFVGDEKSVVEDRIPTSVATGLALATSADEEVMVVDLTVPKTEPVSELQKAEVIAVPEVKKVETAPTDSSAVNSPVARKWTVEELNKLPVGTKIVHPSCGNGEVVVSHGCKYAKWNNNSSHGFIDNKHPWDVAFVVHHISNARKWTVEELNKLPVGTKIVHPSCGNGEVYNPVFNGKPTTKKEVKWSNGGGNSFISNSTPWDVEIEVILPDADKVVEEPAKFKIGDTVLVPFGLAKTPAVITAVDDKKKYTMEPLYARRAGVSRTCAYYESELQPYEPADHNRFCVGDKVKNLQANKELVVVGFAYKESIDEESVQCIVSSEKCIDVFYAKHLVPSSKYGVGDYVECMWNSTKLSRGMIKEAVYSENSWKYKFLPDHVVNMGKHETNLVAEDLIKNPIAIDGSAKNYKIGDKVVWNLTSVDYYVYGYLYSYDVNTPTTNQIMIGNGDKVRPFAVLESELSYAAKYKVGDRVLYPYNGIKHAAGTIETVNHQTGTYGVVLDYAKMYGSTTPSKYYQYEKDIVLLPADPEFTGVKPGDKVRRGTCDGKVLCALYPYEAGKTDTNQFIITPLNCYSPAAYNENDLEVLESPLGTPVKKPAKYKIGDKVMVPFGDRYVTAEVVSYADGTYRTKMDYQPRVQWDTHCCLYEQDLRDTGDNWHNLGSTPEIGKECRVKDSMKTIIPIALAYSDKNAVPMFVGLVNGMCSLNLYRCDSIIPEERKTKFIVGDVVVSIPEGHDDISFMKEWDMEKRTGKVIEVYQHPTITKQHYRVEFAKDNNTRFYLEETALKFQDNCDSPKTSVQ